MAATPMRRCISPAPFYSTLVRFNLAKFPEVEGDLAESWTVAPDLMSYTFKLHPNVKFHDGTPLTSADVKATYERLRNPPAGVVSTRKATFADIGTIETPDPFTVVFKMKNVNAAMLEHFASPWNCVYSAKDLAADPNAPKTKINGTGPFIFVEHVKGSHVVRQEERRITSRRACPISTASRACSRCRPQPCSTRCRADRCWRNSAASRRPSAIASFRRWATRSAIEESSWTLNLLICVQHREEAVRRRAGAQGAAAGDRPLGRQPGPVTHLDACARSVA